MTYSSRALAGVSDTAILAGVAPVNNTPSLPVSASMRDAIATVCTVSKQLKVEYTRVEPNEEGGTVFYMADGIDKSYFVKAVAASSLGIDKPFAVSHHNELLFLLKDAAAAMSVEHTMQMVAKSDEEFAPASVPTQLQFLSDEGVFLHNLSNACMAPKAQLKRTPVWDAQFRLDLNGCLVKSVSKHLYRLRNCEYLCQFSQDDTGTYINIGTSAKLLVSGKNVVFDEIVGLPHSWLTGNLLVMLKTLLKLKVDTALIKISSATGLMLFAFSVGEAKVGFDVIFPGKIVDPATGC